MDVYVSPVFATRSGLARLRIEGIAPSARAVSVMPSSADGDGLLLVTVDGRAAQLDVTLETSEDRVTWTVSPDFDRIDLG